MNNDTLFWYISIPLAIAISEYLFFGPVGEFFDDISYNNKKTFGDYCLIKVFAVAVGTLISMVSTGIIIALTIDVYRTALLWIFGIVVAFLLLVWINMKISKRIENRGK